MTVTTTEARELREFAEKVRRDAIAEARKESGNPDAEYAVDLGAWEWTIKGLQHLYTEAMAGREPRIEIHPMPIAVDSGHYSARVDHNGDVWKLRWVPYV